MQGLSVLILTKNNPAGTLNLIKNVYDIADEIIIGDASNKAAYGQLRGKSRKLNKAKFFRCIPMGYPDPLRMYALKKCKYDWVLLMDSDEFLNDRLKLDIKQIMKSDSADGFLINRANITDSGNVMDASGYQLRLYKKSKTTYNGMPHEFPVVKGIVKTLDKKYSIMQNINLKDYLSSRLRKQVILTVFSTRLSYSDLLEKITGHGSLLRAVIGLYLRLKNANPESELSDFDYNLITKYPVIDYLLRSFPKTSRYLFDVALKYSRQELYYRTHLPPEGRLLQLNISHEIKRHGGVTYYLLIDQNKVVDALNKKFLDATDRGEMLFGWLLYLRYKNGKDYYLHLKPFDKNWAQKFDMEFKAD